MAKGVLDAYEELKQNLIKLRVKFDSLECSHIPNVANCIDLINHLIAEAYQQYLEMKGSKVSVGPSLPSYVNTRQGFLSEIENINDPYGSVPSLHSRVTRWSQRFFKTRRSTHSLIPLTT